MSERRDYLHNLTLTAFYYYWELRDQDGSRPEGLRPWAENPPLSISFFDLKRDAWDEAIQIPAINDILIHTGRINLGDPHYGNPEPLLIENLTRYSSYLRPWVYRWPDHPVLTAVELVFPYYANLIDHSATEHASQGVNLYNTSYLNRSIFISEYAETGYEGHLHSGTYEFDEDVVEFYINLLEEVVPSERR